MKLKPFEVSKKVNSIIDDIANTLQIHADFKVEKRENLLTDIKKEYTFLLTQLVQNLDALTLDQELNNINIDNAKIVILKQLESKYINKPKPVKKQLTEQEKEEKKRASEQRKASKANNTNNTTNGESNFKMKSTDKKGVMKFSIFLEK